MKIRVNELIEVLNYQGNIHNTTFIGPQEVALQLCKTSPNGKQLFLYIVSPHVEIPW